MLNTITNERRAELEARREVLRAELARKRVREMFLANYHRAVFGADIERESPVDAFFRGLGR